MRLLDGVSLVVSAFGLLAGLAVLIATGRPRPALSVALELWMAAGLLRLSAEGSWYALAGAAVILAVRKLVTTSLEPRRHEAR